MDESGEQRRHLRACHTDGVAERTMSGLSSLADDEDWFCWMSFPDPHRPWDPPESEARKISWRDLDLPAGHPGTVEAREKVLAEKPSHWLGYATGAPISVGSASFVGRQARPAVRHPVGRSSPGAIPARVVMRPIPVLIAYGRSRASSGSVWARRGGAGLGGAG